MKKLKYALIVVTLIVAALILSSMFSSQNKDDLRKPAGEKVSKEKVIEVKNEIQTSTIETSGRMYAFKKVDVFAEVSGLLEPQSISFKAGHRYKKGEVMISINPDVYLNSLLAKKSNLLNQLSFLLADLKVDFPESYDSWRSYLDNFDIQSKLNPLPSGLSKREMQYIASHNILSLYYEIKSMEATYEKYTIKAPFNGVVTESNINPGTLVRNGQKLGVFISTSLYEMAVPVRLADVGKMPVGTKVDLITKDKDKNFSGKIVRINHSINPQTQSVQVYIQSGEKGILDGMFLNATIKVKSSKKLARIPISAVVNGNQVKVKTGTNVKLVDVKIIGKTATDYLVDGLRDNSLVIISKSSL